MIEPKLHMSQRKPDEPFAPPRGVPTVNSQYVKPANFRELETELSNISERLVVFDANLRAAAESEKDFCTFVQTFTSSMDTFILQHIEEDRKLTRLIAEDTRRAHEAKREYDALASRFDDDVRPPNPTKIREILSTMSTYIGIVLSLVFMAPLHAVWSAIVTTLTSLGLVRLPVAVAKRRDEREMPDAARRIKSPRQERRTHVHSRQQRDDLKRATQSQPSTQGLSRRLRESKTMLSTKSASSERQQGRTRSRTASTSSTGRHERISSTGNVEDALSVQRRLNTSEKEERDVFVDAREENETPEVSLRHFSNQEVGDEVDSFIDDIDSGRPCWAVPNGESNTFRDDSTFPSSEFWNISADDIRLEMLKESASQGGPLTGEPSTNEPSNREL